mmetsp:Transcript_20859/g.35845  ORF Transcript_20859/g.35845 Transcript_20859/m.35845 type:complete len:475 (-) Transcript_20859:363-1787(-)
MISSFRHSPEMTRMSKKSRAAAARTPAAARLQQKINLTQEAPDELWERFPPTAKGFILGHRNGTLSLSSLIKFWSLPQNIQYATRENSPDIIWGASWYLSLVYHNLGKFAEARALGINGSFFHQCAVSSLYYVRELFNSDAILGEHNLPYFVSGLNASESPDTLESYIRTCLPQEYIDFMGSDANLTTKKHMEGFVHQISDDWLGSSASKRNPHKSLHPRGDTQIKLILVDDVNQEERHSFEIGSATTLKALFNDYAEKRGISLRTLRFSYAGKTLFLSSAGRKIPDELGLQDQDVIMVHDTRKDHEATENDSSSQNPMASKKAKKSKKRSKKKAQCKRNKLQERKQTIKTIDDYKLEHSNKLTKLHEEAEIAHFKQSRQRLNNLAIERSRPKMKSKQSRMPKKSNCLPTMASNLFREDLGGKAGKPKYAIQVGEVQNLYKTTKPSAATARNILSAGFAWIHKRRSFDKTEREP